MIKSVRDVGGRRSIAGSIREAVNKFQLAPPHEWSIPGRDDPSIMAALEVALELEKDEVRDSLPKRLWFSTVLFEGIKAHHNFSLWDRDSEMEGEWMKVRHIRLGNGNARGSEQDWNQLIQEHMIFNINGHFILRVGNLRAQFREAMAQVKIRLGELIAGGLLDKWITLTPPTAGLPRGELERLEKEDGGSQVSLISQLTPIPRQSSPGPPGEALDDAVRKIGTPDWDGDSDKPVLGGAVSQGDNVGNSVAKEEQFISGPSTLEVQDNSNEDRHSKEEHSPDHSSLGTDNTKKKKKKKQKKRREEVGLAS